VRVYVFPDPAEAFKMVKSGKERLMSFSKIGSAMGSSGGILEP
jgi:hypothetical protein